MEGRKEGERDYKANVERPSLAEAQEARSWRNGATRRRKATVPPAPVDANDGEREKAKTSRRTPQDTNDQRPNEQTTKQKQTTPKTRKALPLAENWGMESRTGVAWRPQKGQKDQKGRTKADRRKKTKRIKPGECVRWRPVLGSVLFPPGWY
ncbi:uncharacterized protein SPSK_04633 [Sporothrix schenckii 1099-18]|uniref:Uncharacterized protein n=1 Tax=Sporothrix schenckii 1099-18 TaxID=1397361 RepID=A0A0F2M1G6_SPOSC|nr:uncharacterized protein SPSK_04633 [Sporothrix schenckii 1099-18]KJR83552.1 hypothetical protein SPSK_04633 [Sporothrix schenckii 1099-18]